MNLIFAYSPWFILLCIICAGLYALGLYYRDKKSKEIPKWGIKLLTIIRFIAVFLITFLLLEPLFQTTKTRTEKPIVVIAQDNSESLIFNKDSAFINGKYKQDISVLIADLKKKYEVVTYTFGSELQQQNIFNFKEKETDIALAIKQLNEQYYNRNLGAIIIATDGIYNKGANPYYEAQKLKNIPIYTVALGDTTPIKDVVLQQIVNNRLAYRGNDFPVEVTIKATAFPSQKTTVSILKNGTKIKETEITFKNQNDLVSVPFLLEANTTGLQRYTAVVTPIKQEYTTKNNSKDFFIDVLESKQKILLLANSSHPDISALKNALETNKNYEITTQLINDFENKTEAFSLLILHNLPSKNAPITNLLAKAKNNKTPLLFVLGNQTDYPTFNQLKKGLTLTSSSQFSETQGIVNTNFTLFKYSDELIKNINEFPPIQTPFSKNYQLTNSCEVLLYQKIGLIKTNYPLIAFNKTSENKTGFFIGEGFWRWKYIDYLENNNNNVFNELITQSIQYLVAKEDKSFFRVYSENNFKENEPVILEAEVYNKSYELDNSAEVTIKIKNETGNEFPFSFSKTANRYSLNVGILPAGNYSYIAKTTFNGKNYQETGEFSISELTAEQTIAQANHNLLYNISDITGGELVYPSELNSLKSQLIKKGNLVNVLYSKKEVNDLINLKYLFFIILFLLGIEWFFRKEMAFIKPKLYVLSKHLDT